MYSLYFDKKSGGLKIQRGYSGFSGYNFPDTPYRYNDCYYLCKTRKPLAELAKEMRDEWIDELKSRITALESLKI